MANVYSWVFIDEPVASGSSAGYTVPTGSRAVVRSITLAHFNPGSEGQWYVAAGAGAWIAAGWWEGDDHGDVFYWDGHQVVNEGGDIALYTSQPCSIRLSGYLLTLP